MAALGETTMAYSAWLLMVLRRRSNDGVPLSLATSRASSAYVLLGWRCHSPQNFDDVGAIGENRT
jgi:hypothetical protein